MADPNPAPNPNPTPDPFTDWYKNTIQAHPEKYDPAHFSEGQARAWFPLWDPTSGGFRSSKVDINGKPIEGNNFTHPDECPPGTQAWGENQCRPSNMLPGAGMGGGPGGFPNLPGGGDWGGGFGAGYSFGGGGGFGGGGAYPQFHWPGLPAFTPPTGANESNDPGYAFRLKQGQDALEHSAAARGMLNTGQTATDLTKFGQDYASNEYANVFQRAKDQYAPLLAEWQMKAGGERDAAMAAFQQAWQRYMFGIDDEFRREQMLYGGPSGF